MSDSFFDILGVGRRYHLAAEDLEMRFHERSRQVHPDRHVRADAGTRVKTALAASQLNQAYRTLRDPVQRAEYLLRLEGVEIADERGGRQVAPGFLLEVMELREQLAEAKAEGDLVRVKALGAEVAARRAATMVEAEAAFSSYEAGDRGALEAAADALIAERYFRRFLDEVAVIDEGHDPATAGRP